MGGAASTILSRTQPRLGCAFCLSHAPLKGIEVRLKLCNALQLRIQLPIHIVKPLFKALHNFQ
jgi:hypothetical protein